MPVPTVPDMLGPLFRQRLAIGVPPGRDVPPDRLAIACRELNGQLYTIRNLPTVTHTPPPSEPTNLQRMAQLYQRVTAPTNGAQQGPFTVEENQTVQQLHYLYEVDVAPPLGDTTAAGARWPQSAIHARLLHEIRREFDDLPYPAPPEGWERAVHDVAARLLVQAMLQGLQPTDVRVVASQELVPVAGRHQGGLSLHLAAWNAAAPPPEHTAETADPNVWDPSNPLGNEPNLLRAPLQMTWRGEKPLTWQ